AAAAMPGMRRAADPAPGLLALALVLVQHLRVLRRWNGGPGLTRRRTNGTQTRYSGDLLEPGACRAPGGSLGQVDQLGLVAAGTTGFDVAVYRRRFFLPESKYSNRSPAALGRAVLSPAVSFQGVYR